MKRGAFTLLSLVAACANVLGFQAGELDDRHSDAASGEGGLGEAGLAGAPAPAEGGRSGSIIPSVAGAPDPVAGAPATPGENDYSVVSVAVAAHVCAVLSNGKLKCWGANDSGQLGLGDDEHRGEEGDDEMGANLPFVPLGQARAQQVTVGARHTCVLTTESEVRCWGSNSDGQLGIPDVEQLISAADAPVLDLGPGTVDFIAAGAGHTCARFATGDVKCWGANYVGQLGVGDALHRGKQAGDLGGQLPFVDLGGGRVEQLSIGDQHACALGTGGLKCWGATSYNYFMPEPGQYNLGDEPFEMGEALPLVDLGWAAVAAVASGGLHNCALSLQGAVKCWGDSSSGQLGYGNSEPHIDLTKLGAELDEVELDGTAAALSAGLSHTCALFTDNRLKCWGGNEWGQLGSGNSHNYGFYPDEMGAKLPAVDLGRDHTIVGIEAGGNTNCAILDQGRLKCWGQNDHGALGLGHQHAIGPYPGEMGDALPFVEL